MHTVAEMTPEEKRTLSWLFRASMWWRIFYGALRVALGVTLLKMIGARFSDIIYLLMSHEFTGKAGDAVLEQLYKLFETHQFTVTYFIAGYFLFWGSIEIVLSYCLLRHRLWAFPIALALIALFIIYSMFRYTYTHSLTLLGIIIIDIVIMYIIHREYRVLQRDPNAP